MEKFCRYCGMPLKGKICFCREAQKAREREADVDARTDTHEHLNTDEPKAEEKTGDSREAEGSKMPDEEKKTDEKSAPENTEKADENTGSTETQSAQCQAEPNVLPPHPGNVSSAQLALRESKQTIISLARDPINLMKQSHSLSASVCAMLLISLSISIMLCLMTLKSRLSGIVDITILDVSSRDIFSSAVLTVVLSSGFLFLALLVISKLFNGTIKSSMLFTTISKASIPYTAYFLFVSAVAFIWPKINDRLILTLMILLLLVVTIYSLYLVEIGTRSQLTNDAVRIVSLSIAYAVSLVLMFRFMQGNLIGSMENMIILRDLFSR